MSFNQFLSNIFGIVPNILNWGSTILNSLMSNYIFKIIIYVGIIILAINIILSIINLILGKLNKPTKDKEV